MSRSIRKETSSLAFGIVGRFGGSSAGFVVAALNAASATSRELVVLRVLSADILCPHSFIVIGMACGAWLQSTNQKPSALVGKRSTRRRPQIIFELHGLALVEKPPGWFAALAAKQRRLVGAAGIEPATSPV